MCVRNRILHSLVRYVLESTHCKINRLYINKIFNSDVFVDLSAKILTYSLVDFVICFDL